MKVLCVYCLTTTDNKLWAITNSFSLLGKFIKISIFHSSISLRLPSVF